MKKISDSEILRKGIINICIENKPESKIKQMEIQKLKDQVKILEDDYDNYLDDVVDKVYKLKKSFLHAICKENSLKIGDYYRYKGKPLILKDIYIASGDSIRWLIQNNTLKELEELRKKGAGFNININLDFHKVSAQGKETDYIEHSWYLPIFKDLVDSGELVYSREPIKGIPSKIPVTSVTALGDNFYLFISETKRKKRLFKGYCARRLEGLKRDKLHFLEGLRKKHKDEMKLEYVFMQTSVSKYGSSLELGKIENLIELNSDEDVVNALL